MDAAEFAREMNRYALAANLDVDPVPPFSEEDIQNFERNGGTDWMDEIYRTGLAQTHQISLSGKASKVRYFLSGSYLDQEGILINPGYKRYSLRTNFDAQINDWLSFGLNWRSEERRVGKESRGR